MIRDIYYQIICTTALLMLQLIDGATGLCNHTMALQCLQTAEQQFQAAVNGDFSQFCKSQKEDLELKRCLQRSTGGCERATKEMFLIQATRFLRPIETQCSYLSSHRQHTNAASTAQVGSGCRQETLPFCYRDLVTKFDPSNDLKKAFTVTNPLVERNFNQQTVCSKLESVDFEKTLTCLESTGCESERVFSEEGENQHILYSTLVRLLAGICQPGCDSIASRIQKANDCFRQENLVPYLTGTSQYHSLKPTCSELTQAFQCVRLNMETCATGSDYLYILYDITSLNPDIHKTCPDLDASFYISKGSVLTCLSTPYLGIFVIFTLLTSTNLL